MSLHFELPKTTHRKVWLEKMFMGLISVVTAIAILGGLLATLDAFESRQPPEYAPQFILIEQPDFTGCVGPGGCGGLKIKPPSSKPVSINGVLFFIPEPLPWDNAAQDFPEEHDENEAKEPFGY